MGNAMNRRVGLTGIRTNAPGRSTGTQTNPRAANSIPPLPAQSVTAGRELVEPFVDLREFGAGLLFFLVLLLAACGVALGAFLHKALVS
jgi:hypothetical protein